MATTNDFGAFFRGTRQALGLSLREFCRQTGFDQANVSRIERGIVAPPKSEKVLESYAKSLKLKPDSAGWERFMALAKPPTKPRRGLGHRNWVTAKHLEDWAGTQDARTLLPQLIRRLIRATANGAVSVEAPAGEQTQRPGWDVIAEATAKSEFVPMGASRWELGADKDPKKKADDDFAKRLKNSSGLTKRISAFVFVTPRKWQKKAEWVETKTRLKSWKEVRVYDSASLEEWLESAPAVDVWLARQLGICPPGLAELDEYWKNLQALTAPCLAPEVYLASREKQFDELKKWVEGPPDTILIQSRSSPIEALDFVVASSRKPQLGEELAARALIVETRDAWRSVAVGDAKLILVVHPKLAIEAELVAEAVRNGHHVVVCANIPLGSQHKRIDLESVSGLSLQKALEAQGIARIAAEDLTTKSGGSIEVLKRITSRHPGTRQPDWSKTRTITPLLLAGQWDHSSEGDREAITKIAGSDYRDVAELAEQWSSCPDPMVASTLTGWKLISRDDSWTLAAHLLNEDDLKRFETVALEVLGELDPACELPSDGRWKANILGKVRLHSEVLRTGLAESLALFGARPPKGKRPSFDPRGFANHIVRKLLHGKKWKVWASLSSVISLLAEAAPDAFLSALEEDLLRRFPAVLELFDSKSPLLGSNPYTGLLFALETVLWDRNSLSRASLALARLHEIAPATKLANSPMQSLKHAFMPWYAQTTAPVGERIQVLEIISRKFSKAGWDLLLELLPTPYSHAMINRRPVFQPWAFHWSEEDARADRAFQVEASSYLVISLASRAPERLKEAFQLLENFPRVGREKLLEQIMNLNPNEMKMEIRQALSETIREKVKLHKRFADKDWPLKGLLEELERVQRHIEPADAVSKNAWLFDDYWKIQHGILRSMPPSEMDVNAAEKVVTDLRVAALKEVRSEQKWEGVLALIEVAMRPDQVGQTVARSRTIGDAARILPAFLTDSRKELVAFAKGYAWERKYRDGWEWMKKLRFKKWSDDQIVEFALALPSEREVWNLLAQRGEKAIVDYWKRVPLLCSSKSVEDVSHAAEMLTKSGRPFIAVGQLAMASLRGVKVLSSSIISVLESGRGVLSDDTQLQILQNARYDLNNLIGELQERLSAKEHGLDANIVANLEWTYLDLLDGDPTVPKTLYMSLAQEPNTFVELLKILFRRSDEKEVEAPMGEPSDSSQLRAAQVFRLLSSWQQVPGSRPDGSIDENHLRTWVKEVQRLAEAEARREVGDIEIGKIFAHASEEADGSWPCIAVRDAIDELGTEALSEGFEIGIINKRGAYWKALDEGGDQERALAKQYSEWADVSRNEWPKTAASLRRVAEQYEGEAQRADAKTAAR